MLWSLILGLAAGLLLAYLLLLLVLLRGRPRIAFGDAMRLLPDLVRLVRRLAADRSLPRGVRWRIYALLAYLVSPIDLIPDFVPVLGVADDAIVAACILRSVARRAGSDALERHWTGTPDGLQAVYRLAGIANSFSETT